MPKSYDTIIIGAGIAGCCAAYFLKQKGSDILILDRSGIAASGGSGAAGAFVSPKIGKGSVLQSLTNEAFDFAKDFYLQNFPDYFHQTGVIRIPKDEEDAQKFPVYETFNASKYRWIREEELDILGIKNSHDSFLFHEGGVCDAPGLCAAILKDIPHAQYHVTQLSYEEGLWHIGDFRAKNIVLATGYENTLFDMRYMGVRGTWGSRGDYRSRLGLNVSMHKSISVSANIDGVIKIGATHVKAKEPCKQCKGEPLAALFEKASAMVDTGDFELVETYCGMRAGSKDYFPLVGTVVDVSYMLSHYPKITSGAKIDDPFKKIEHLYICNGLGGRGFVFAPMMGEMLAEHIANGRQIDLRVDPDRLFLKWCRRELIINSKDLSDSSQVLL
ncbi:MAG: FAD-dependent oxidoreductase [Campylobacterota bacterium]|nr:FAD-dependent oxidoreductase [Campylobacterota bacterium]